jgi:3-polyprenyl-4-hydroxybenzoate decarboxylase
MPYPYKSFRDWLTDEEKIGNVLRIKPPIKCGDYDNIVEIGRGIPGKQPQTDMRAMTRYLHSLPGKPVGVIDRPINNRPDIPVVINPYATRERVLRGMGMSDKNQLLQKVKEIPYKRIKPRKLTRGDSPCKDQVMGSASIDLRRDIPRVWVEFQQCLWSGFNGTIVLYDQETNTHGLGKLRVGQYEWKDADPAKPHNETRVATEMFAAVLRGTSRPTGTGRFYLKHKALNKTMPGAFTFGDPVDLDFLAAIKTLPWPENGDEYEALGGFRGEPVDVVPSETIPGLMVPAHSEWVIEGEFLLEDEKLPSFAGEDDFIPYVTGGRVYTVFKANCITHRNKPYWSSNVSSVDGMNGHEGSHVALSALNLEVEALSFLRSAGFKVKDVALLVGPGMTVVQLEVDGAGKPYPYYGKKVGMALAAYGVHIASPYTVVVGPDIDPHDAMDVLWAITMLAAPISDSILLDNDLPGLASELGTRVGIRPRGERVIIDATIPVPERYDHWSPRSDPADWERVAIKRMKDKLG